MDLETERLEQRLRVVLSDPGHAVPPDTVPLAAVHQGAVRRRRRRAAGLAAAGAAVLAAVAVPVGFALAPGSAPQRITAVGTTDPSADARPEPTTAGTAPGQPSASGAATGAAPVQTGSTAALPWAGARVASVTATSTRRIVVLGLLGDTGRCRPPGCVRLAASDDGGATYQPLAAPASARNAGRDGATDVRFGSASDGWVYGPALWSTHDAGQHWARQRLGGAVRHLAAARGHVWALVSASGDTEKLWTSAVGSDAWHPVAGVTVDAPGDVTTLGGRVVVVGIGSSPAWVGDPAGFAAHPGPCPDGLAAELSGNATLWATCVTGTTAVLATSADGTGWTPVPVRRADALPNSLQVGARGADALLAVGPTEPIARVSADGSTAALPTPPPAGEDVGYIGFTTSDVGLAVVGGRLYRTTDGGNTWHLATPV